MYKKIAAVGVVLSLFAGCASVPMESPEASAVAKTFSAPAPGTAGLYIYRAAGVGTALKKDVWVDGKCIGETAPNMFFYEEVEGDQKYKISTESEFGNNDLIVQTQSGRNYYIKQYIKMGLFVGGANLKLMSEQSGKEAISKLELAKKGVCSKRYR
ncbi:DUF2846 domain-containing protein [Alcanivorax sp. 1008]|uniref:DUF2846 domain-containing protein n=1 Tax=Alcanivorax sp. 1008 TaxID=2816853 RepID=UPI001DFA4B44|nr:DUF2846 domain-containing protein [Alcanivorax sp. 1008]MCC1496819.1 DUF2846 domain-containing protein [Alcanivorax sp. 1008]